MQMISTPWLARFSAGAGGIVEVVCDKTLLQTSPVVTGKVEGSLPVSDTGKCLGVGEG